jgi:hypothetical protein
MWINDSMWSVQSKVLESFFTDMVTCGLGGANDVCRPYRVHDRVYVLALDTLSHVSRGNIPGHCLPSYGCVGPMRTSCL